MKKFFCLIGFSLMFVSLVMGCGPKEPRTPGVVPASGQVTLDGQPVADALVCISPTPAGSDTKSASTTTDADGKFSLGVLIPGEGALPGNYSVLIVKKVMTTDVTDEERQRRADTPNPVIETYEFVVPEKYSNPKTSGLTLTIPSEGKTDILFELKKD